MRVLDLSNVKPKHLLNLIFKGNGSRHSVNQRNLVTYFNPDSFISEQYRNIRTNILFLTTEHHSHTVLFTSPGEGEGKSTTIANLAVSMVQKKERVLLIDANLRNPSAHLIFNIPNSIGLTSYLTGKVQFEDTICHTGIGMLDIMPSGKLPSNPSELLSSRMMSDLLTRIQQYYDIVLIDSPSTEVPDTKLLANLCDGVVIVLQRGKTNMEEAIQAKKVLEFAKGKIIGAIYNEK